MEHGRGINKARKKFEVARFIAYHNLSLVGLLETKVKRNGLGELYLRMFPTGVSRPIWRGMMLEECGSTCGYFELLEPIYSSCGITDSWYPVYVYFCV